MTELILGIILEGIKGFNVERKKSFSKKYGKIIQKVKDAENAHFPDFNCDVLALAEEELETFVGAYYEELKIHNREAGNV